ncbi:MAG: MgtC/SapB family protein [Rhodocyclaceae bacterium]|nr:MgtC/SapB family protein [Rhodocyclaceae bacterium]
MDMVTAIDVHQFRLFLISLGIGLFMGLERERRPSARAGVRTFALVALFGTLSAMLGQVTGSAWLPAVGLAAVGAMMIVANGVHPDEQDPGTTSVVALLVCYVLGALVWHGQVQLAVTLAIGVTALLYFKAELEGISLQLSPRDLNSILQFAILSLVVLPVLPDREYGPFLAFNPHQIWLMVVLISGVSLAGYAALRLVGGRHGVTVVCLFGGLVSSTATTLVFSRHARKGSEFVATASIVVVLANLTMMLRLLAIAAVLSPKLLPQVALMFCPGLALGTLASLPLWHRPDGAGDLPVPETRNPTELRAALGFGLLYAAVLFCAAWLSEAVGSKGMYALALISGLTDVDAITLSSLRLFALDKLTPEAVVTTIALAVLANLAFKFGLAFVIGGSALARKVLPGMLAAGIGMMAGLAFV